MKGYVWKEKSPKCQIIKLQLYIFLLHYTEQSLNEK